MKIERLSLTNRQLTAFAVLHDALASAGVVDVILAGILILAVWDACITNLVASGVVILGVEKSVGVVGVVRLFIQFVVRAARAVHVAVSSLHLTHRGKYIHITTGWSPHTKEEG